MDPSSAERMCLAPLPAIPGLKRVHARRLRDVYRSADWPYQDLVEIELFAAGVLEQVKAGFEDFFTSNGLVV